MSKTKTTIRTDRLRELANYRPPRSTGRRKFDFSCLNENDEGEPVPNKCGSLGCKLGEAPLLWPNDWRFNQDGEPVMNGYSYLFKSSCDWFGISNAQDTALFYPNSHFSEQFGLKRLPATATRKQVADNIRLFCDKADAGDYN